MGIMIVHNIKSDTLVAAINILFRSNLIDKFRGQTYVGASNMFDKKEVALQLKFRHSNPKAVSTHGHSLSLAVTDLIFPRYLEDTYWDTIKFSPKRGEMLGVLEGVDDEQPVFRKSPSTYSNLQSILCKDAQKIRKSLTREVRSRIVG